MRVWDQVPPENLCDRHLLGEHREIHVIWSVLKRGEGGYSNHPEVKRWAGRKYFLYQRHQAVAREMKRRGFKHKSYLQPKGPSTTINGPPLPWDDQLAKLKAKGCECKIPS